MDFTKLTDFLDDVTPEVIGCPRPTIIHRLRWAAIEFCKQTGVSVETSEELDIDANEPIFDVPTPGSDVRVWQVLWVTTTQGSLTEEDRRYLAERNARWEVATAKWPTGFVRVNASQIRFVPIPSASHLGAMTVHASYIPVPTAEQIDAVLFAEYREAIVTGCLSKLLNMSRETWYDPNEALTREAQFRYEMSNAAARATKDFTAGPTMAVISALA